MVKRLHNEKNEKELHNNNLMIKKQYNGNNIIRRYYDKINKNEMIE